MNKFLVLLILFLFCMSGCAAMGEKMKEGSGTSQSLGNNRHYIEIEKNFFTMSSTNTEMFSRWAEKAKQACNGKDYKIIDRHLEQREHYQPKLIGEIECK